MTGYLLNFSLYTLGMIGVIFAALFAFKVFSAKCMHKKSDFLNVEDSMALSQRKTLYVVNAGTERFLIAADTERTTLISKLDNKNEKFEKGIKLVTDAIDKRDEIKEPIERKDRSTKLCSFDGVESIGEFSSLLEFQEKKSGKGPMMRELAKKLSAV